MERNIRIVVAKNSWRRRRIRWERGRGTICGWRWGAVCRLWQAMVQDRCNNSVILFLDDIPHRLWRVSILMCQSPKDSTMFVVICREWWRIAVSRGASQRSINCPQFSHTLTTCKFLESPQARNNAMIGKGNQIQRRMDIDMHSNLLKRPSLSSNTNSFQIVSKATSLEAWDNLPCNIQKLVGKVSQKVQTAPKHWGRWFRWSPSR